jgi:hypothetical protein
MLGTRPRTQKRARRSLMLRTFRQRGLGALACPASAGGPSGLAQRVPAVSPCRGAMRPRRDETASSDADAPLRLWPLRSRSGRHFRAVGAPERKITKQSQKTPGGCPRGSREVDVRGRGRRAFPPGCAGWRCQLARRRVEGASTAVPWRGARARRRSYPVPRAKARPGVQVPVRLLTVPELGGPGEGLPLPFFSHRGGVGGDEVGRNCLLDASLPSVEDANGGSA